MQSDNYLGSRRTAYIDFDGVLFYSEVEPLYSSLLAFGVDISLEAINQLWLDRYQDEKHNIANQRDLYNFVSGMLYPNRNIVMQESLFRRKLLEVRKSFVSSGVYKKLFQPTQFTHSLKDLILGLGLDVCILTNRDPNITNVLCSEYLRSDMRIVSLGMQNISKLRYIVQDCSHACIFMDDVISNLKSNDIVIPGNLTRIYATWGYGSIQSSYSENENILSADQAQALKILVNFSLGI